MFPGHLVALFKFARLSTTTSCDHEWSYIYSSPASTSAGRWWRRRRRRRHHLLHPPPNCLCDCARYQFLHSFRLSLLLLALLLLLLLLLSVYYSVFPFLLLGATGSMIATLARERERERERPRRYSPLPSFLPGFKACPYYRCSLVKPITAHLYPTGLFKLTSVRN